MKGQMQLLAAGVIIVIIIVAAFMLGLFPLAISGDKVCTGSYVLEDISQFEVLECYYGLLADYESVSSTSGMVCSWTGSYYKCQKSYHYENPRTDRYVDQTCDGRDEDKSQALAEVQNCENGLKNSYEQVSSKESICDQKDSGDWLCFEIFFCSVPIENYDCYSDSDCGTPHFVGDKYCGQNNANDVVYWDFNRPVCITNVDYPYCSSETTPQTQKTCPYGCENGACLPEPVQPTCSDGIMNGDETGIDCGGSCQPCTTTAVCGDGTCEMDETYLNCPDDCPAPPINEFPWLTFIIILVGIIAVVFLALRYL